MSALILAADGVNVAQNVGFGIIAALMIFAALCVVSTKNVVHAALWLVIVLAGVAAQYVLAAAEFVAVSQVMVYIGAVMVLFLFGIMLTRAQIGKEDGLNNKGWGLGIPVAVVLFGLLAFVVIDFHNSDEIAALPGVNADGVVLDEGSNSAAAVLAGPVSELLDADPNAGRDEITAVVVDVVGDDRDRVVNAAVAAIEGVVADEETPVSAETLAGPISEAVASTGQSLVTQAIADRVLSPYLAPFFGMTFVLLAAAIGSIVLARKD